MVAERAWLVPGCADARLMPRIVVAALGQIVTGHFQGDEVHCGHTAWTLWVIVGAVIPEAVLRRQHEVLSHPHQLDLLRRRGNVRSLSLIIGDEQIHAQSFYFLQFTRAVTDEPSRERHL